MSYLWFWRNAAMRRAIASSLLVAFGAFLLMPLLTLLLWAFTNRWFYPSLLPQEFGVRWWGWIVDNTDLSKAAAYSFTIAPTVTILAAVICLPAAYAFSRFRFPLRRFLYVSLLASNAFPKLGLYIAIATVFYRLGLIGTFWGVVLVQLINTLVTMTWIPAAGFSSVPRELEEAARDLGAGPWRVFFSVTLPIALPSVIVASILTFLGSLDEAQATLLIGSPNIVTMPVQMYTLVGNYPEPVGAIFSLLLTLPSVALLLLARKFLLGGYIAAGFKG
jgi:putative spermidine/putrescine transport system permease protein